MSSALQFNRRSFGRQEIGMFSREPLVSQASDFEQHRIAQLQSEVTMLRQALMDTEHALALKEKLLHNMHSRELELRAQLVKG